MPHVEIPGAVTLRVFGLPAPQGSKKHVGKGRMVESSKALPAWRRAVAKAAAAKAAETGQLEVALSCVATFILPRPKRSKFNGPAGPPDLDKLQRALGDGLEAGGLIANDSRIVHWDARKQWAGSNGLTGAVVVLSPAVTAQSRYGLTT